MKNISIQFFAPLLACFLFQLTSNAQIGIGTISPKGALHLNSTDQGLVYPRVALTATNVASPVTNPNGALLEGTVVYNTNTTSNGANDVYPGIYAWNGSSWKPQFMRNHYQKFEQTAVCQRTSIREAVGNDPDPNNVDNVAGLTNQTFTPRYSGTYKVVVNVNFAAGRMIDFTNDDAISLATSEGAFFFSMNGGSIDIDPTSASYDYNEGWIYTHSYSSYNSIETPALEDDLVPHFGTLVYHLYLNSNTTYTFNLSNCINTGEQFFLDGGDPPSGGGTSDGQGHIGHENPCTVEFTFIK